VEIPETTAAEVERVPANFDVLYVPKLDGISWFDVVESGLKSCASDYGFTATTIAPPKADPAIQAQIVLDNITGGYGAIIVCPLDDEKINSAFSRANQAGVMTFSNEGYTLTNVTYDIAAMSNQSFGESIMEAGIGYTGGTGSYIVSVGFLNGVAHNAWADSEISYQQANASGLVNALGYSQGTDRFEDTEDEEVAAEKLKEILDNNKDINLIVGNSFTTGIAAGEKTKNVMFVGTGLPITIGKYIDSERLQEGFFWDPYLIGYAMGYIALKSWMGEVPSEGDSVAKPDGTAIEGYESLGVSSNKNGGNIIFGNAIESITKGNLEQWYRRFEEYGWPQRQS
jgi:rhamnose transport system substrate-binding protein